MSHKAVIDFVRHPFLIAEEASAARQAGPPGSEWIICADSAHGLGIATCLGKVARVSGDLLGHRGLHRAVIASLAEASGRSLGVSRAVVATGACLAILLGLAHSPISEGTRWA